MSEQQRHDFTIPSFAEARGMTVTRARREVAQLLAAKKIRSVGTIDTGRRGKKPEGFVHVEAIGLPEPTAAE